MFNTYLSNATNNDDELDELIKKISTIDYTAFYRAYVISTDDPLHLGRVLIRIPQIHGAATSIGKSNYVDNLSLPWASPASLPMGNDSGCYLIPNVGDIVFVTFEGGDSTLPIYFGSVLTNRGDTRYTKSKGLNANEVYSSNEDDINSEVVRGCEKVIYKSLKGATIIINDYDGEENIRITDQSGQSIIMENTSKGYLDRRGNSLGKNPMSQIVLTNNNGDSIKLTKGEIVIKSTNVIIESDNFKQVKTSDYEFTDELDLADMILGSEKK